MYQIKNVLIGLDGSKMDADLLQYASYLVSISDVEKVVFVNFIKNLQVPSEVLKEFPDLVEKAVDERKDKLKKQVKECFDLSQGLEYKYVVEESSVLKGYLRLASDYDIDLIIIGRKIHLKGSGVLAQRLARRAACSLLIVPEGTNSEIRRIMVPMDYSEYAKKALERGVCLAERVSPAAEVISCNVYEVPVGYHYTGKSFDEFAEIMKKNARKDFEKVLQEIPTNEIKVRDVYSLNDNDDPIDNLYYEGKKVKADLMVIGAKGRTATTAMFLGSVAERLIVLDKEFPLMVVRPKGKNAGILDMLMEI